MATTKKKNAAKGSKPSNNSRKTGKKETKKVPGNPSKKTTVKDSSKKKPAKTNVADILRLLKLKGNTEVFICDGKEECVQVKNIPDKTLKREVRVVMPNAGGITHNYSCYKIILKK